MIYLSEIVRRTMTVNIQTSQGRDIAVQSFDYAVPAISVMAAFSMTVVGAVVSTPRRIRARSAGGGRSAGLAVRQALSRGATAAGGGATFVDSPTARAA